MVGQTKAEAQALYKATMDGFLVTGAKKMPYAVDKINSFRIVENGTPFEMNGVKITKVNLEEKGGTGMWITQEGTGKSVSDYAYIYSTDGSYGNWKDAERGSTGHWWYRAVDPTTVKAVLFGAGNYDMVLVKLN